MPRQEISIPFPRELYDDIIRFSDGKIDPVFLAENQVLQWVENSFTFGANWSEDRIEQVAEKYAPQVLELWREKDEKRWKEFSSERRPLVWKEVSIPSGSAVRMFYGGEHYYAEIKAGQILDGDKGYSPSEWASKIAGGTSRNAWRDLWFREHGSKTWVPAQLLRDQAQEELRRRGGETVDPAP